MRTTIPILVRVGIEEGDVDVVRVESTALKVSGRVGRGGDRSKGGDWQIGVLSRYSVLVAGSQDLYIVIGMLYGILEHTCVIERCFSPLSRCPAGEKKTCYLDKLTD